MADGTPYLDALLKLVLRVFSNGTYQTSVGGGSTGINVQAPLTSTPNPTTQNVDIGLGPITDNYFSGVLPATKTQAFVDAGAIARTSFTAVAGYMYPFNFTAASQVINFPKITAAIAGQPVAIFNLGTGSTACTLVPSGTDAMGVGAAAGATVSYAVTGGFASLVLTPCLTTGQWVPGI